MLVAVTHSEQQIGWSIMAYTRVAWQKADKKISYYFYPDALLFPCWKQKKQDINWAATKRKKTGKTLVELDGRKGKTKFGETLIFGGTRVCFLYRSVNIDQLIIRNIPDPLLCNKLT